jgi:hypothetical protein
MDHHLRYIQNLFKRTVLLWQKFWIREGKSNSQKSNWASHCTCLCDFMLCPSFLPLKNTNYWWKMKGKKFQVVLDSLESGELYALAPVVFCFLCFVYLFRIPQMSNLFTLEPGHLERWLWEPGQKLRLNMLNVDLQLCLQSYCICITFKGTTILEVHLQQTMCIFCRVC